MPRLWSDGPARSQATRDGHGQARVTAVRLARRTARHQSGQAASSWARANRQRRARHLPLRALRCEPFAPGHRVEPSRPDDERLCHDDLMTELAAYILPEGLAIQY